MPLLRVTGEVTVGSDPELRYTQTGKAVASFSAIASKSKKDDAGNWVDDKEQWVRVTVWDQAAEHVAESVVKGMRVVITGDIYTEKYTDKDGVERTSTNVTAHEVGVSLRFGTATYTKAERSNTSAPAGGADPWATGSTGQAGSIQTGASTAPPF